MKISTSRKGGFTLVEIMIVIAIIAMLASIAIPNFVKARNTAKKTACINNLQQIENAVNMWATETKKQDSSTYTLEDVKGYIKLDSDGQIPQCPAGGTYSPGATVIDPPTCSVAGHKVP